jgi:1-acyl-sn-glycerol-3-phosphate acyltransferase
MNLYLLRRLFDALYVRRFLFRACECKVYHPEQLPISGPAIFVSNHASLGDAMVIQLLYPGAMLGHIRPTGARDFFLKSALAYWAARDIMRMCFLDRESGTRAKDGEDIFSEFRKPLREGNMLIYFPQGTRSRGSPFLPGVYHLARAFPDVPIIPVLLLGTREMFPRGTRWPRPHPVTVYIGERFFPRENETPREYARRLEDYVYQLQDECS